MPADRSASFPPQKVFLALPSLRELSFSKHFCTPIPAAIEIDPTGVSVYSASSSSESRIFEASGVVVSPVVQKNLCAMADLHVQSVPGKAFSDCRSQCPFKGPEGVAPLEPYFPVSLSDPSQARRRRARSEYS
jgi:hypothetical protein